MNEYTIEKLASYFDEQELSEILGMDKTAAANNAVAAGYEDEIVKLAALANGDAIADAYEYGRTLAQDEFFKTAGPATNAARAIAEAASNAYSGARGGIKNLLNRGAEVAGQTVGTGSDYAQRFSRALGDIGAEAAGLGGDLLQGTGALGMSGLRGGARFGETAARGAYETAKPLAKGLLEHADNAAEWAGKNPILAGGLGALGAGGLGAGGLGAYLLTKKSEDHEAKKNAIKMAILNGQL